MGGVLDDGVVAGKEMMILLMTTGGAIISSLCFQIFGGIHG